MGIQPLDPTDTYRKAGGGLLDHRGTLVPSDRVDPDKESGVGRVLLMTKALDVIARTWRRLGAELSPLGVAVDPVEIGSLTEPEDGLYQLRFAGGTAAARAGDNAAQVDVTHVMTVRFVGMHVEMRMEKGDEIEGSVGVSGGAPRRGARWAEIPYREMATGLDGLENRVYATDELLYEGAPAEVTLTAHYTESDPPSVNTTILQGSPVTVGIAEVTAGAAPALGEPVRGMGAPSIGRWTHSVLAEGEQGGDIGRYRSYFLVEVLPTGD